MRCWSGRDEHHVTERDTLPGLLVGTRAHYRSKYSLVIGARRSGRDLRPDRLVERGEPAREVRHVRRLAIIADTGVDDAVALLFAATDPRATIELVVASWGNCTVEHAVVNSLRVLEAADVDTPVHIGSARPLGESATTVSPAIIMGDDGFGDLGLPPPSRQASSTPGHIALVEAIDAAPGAITIVCLSPMTVLAEALRHDPDLPRKAGGLIALGGALGHGNVTAAAEANIANDPAAAAAVVAAFGDPSAGPTPRLVPLDACEPMVLTRTDLNALAASDLAGRELVHQVLDAVWSMARLETGGTGVLVADLLAVMTNAEPVLCDWRTLPLAVDTGRSAAWGATVADRRLERIERADLDDATRAMVLEMMGVVPARWDVAVGAHADRCRSAITTWLRGRGSGPSHDHGIPI
jgi:inosine-uridine nucleoside N-ribohydrolase